jgi:ATP-dependent Clp protease ATP-binding subunit ClpC
LAAEILLLALGPVVLLGWLAWPLVLLILSKVGFSYLARSVLSEFFSTGIFETIPSQPFFSSLVLWFLSSFVWVLDLIIAVLIIRGFIKIKLRNPELKAKISQALAAPQNYDLAQFLSYEADRALKKTIKQAKKSKKEPTSDLLFYFLLADNPRLNFVFSRALVNIEEIKTALLKLYGGQTPVKLTGVRPPSASALEKVILEALQIAQNKGHSRVTAGDLLSSLAKHNSFFEQILIKANLKDRDIAELSCWLERLQEESSKRRRFWEAENLARFGSLGKDFAAGYTIALDQYSQDLTKSLKFSLPQIIGHKEELEAVERILSQREINNVLLVGEVGCGRRSIVQGLVVKSILGQSSPQINYKRIVQLNITSLLARTATTEEVETILDTICQEAVKAGNIILVIDEFHNFIGFAKERPGAIDISGILGSYLGLPQFQLIAISDFAGLHKNIEQNPGLLSLFQKVEVSEISSDECLLLLERAALSLERIHHLFVSFPALKEIISLSEKYIADLPFPKKAMDLLDQVLVFAGKNPKEKIVLPRHVAEVVKQKTKIPVGEIETKEKDILLNLESLIGQRLINQTEAVKEVSEALRRARAGIAVRKGPMGSFLFMGPTGVGKTETAKALAEIYFGSEQRMIRLDMSEFQAIGDIPRLLGSPGEEGLLTTKVRENPFSLVLLDELEKAHSNILNLFLQVLDEGHITDGLGRKVDFKNTIIIATSNAGFQIILEALKQGTEWGSVKGKILDYLFSQAIFRPEFINRFDATIVFKPLTKENLLDIARLLLTKLQKTLKEKHIDFIFGKELQEKLVELGYNPTFGARQMQRVLQDRVENPLARALLSGDLKRGDKVQVDSRTFELKIN